MSWAARKTGATSVSARVFRAVTFSAALGGLIAAVVAIGAVDWLIGAHADRRLRAAADTLSGELDEEAREQDDSLQEVLEDENGEIVTSGIRLALYRGTTLIAGDSWAPALTQPQCVTRGLLGERIRACARWREGDLIVAAERREEEMLRWLYLTAGLSAVLIGGVFGGWISLRLTGWAIRPLSDLTQRVRSLRPEDPDAARLGPPIAVDDVEAIRAALASAVSQLREHMTRLERFSADAAHELKTPLTLLRGELDLLAEETEDRAARQRLLRAAARTAHLAELVEGLLCLASPGARLDADPNAVALSEVVADALRDLTPAQHDRVVQPADAEGLVRGDAILLRVLVRNAVDNALKFSEGVVEVRLIERDPQVLLTVRDQGPGVAAELQRRVFEPFFRGPADGSGYGLGLALVGHIARMHGGTATFEEVSRGAQLLIQLPAWSADPHPAEA